MRISRTSAAAALDRWKKISFRILDVMGGWINFDKTKALQSARMKLIWRVCYSLRYITVTMIIWIWDRSCIVKDKTKRNNSEEKVQIDNIATHVSLSITDYHISDPQLKPTYQNRGFFTPVSDNYCDLTVVDSYHVQSQITTRYLVDTLKPKNTMFGTTSRKELVLF